MKENINKNMNGKLGEAFSTGYDASSFGQAKGDCPYQEQDAKSRSEWHEGWEEAATDSNLILFKKYGVFK